MNSSEILEHWYRALHAEIGICLLTDDLERLRQKLYVARRDANDPSLDALSIVTSPISPNQLWIVKRNATDS